MGTRQPHPTANLYVDIMRHRSPAVLASPFFPLSSARSGSPYGLIASESYSYRILHLFLMHVNAIRRRREQGQIEHLEVAGADRDSTWAGRSLCGVSRQPTEGLGADS